MDEVLERLAAMRFAYADDDEAALAEMKRRIVEVARRTDEPQTYSELVSGIEFVLPSVNGGEPYQIDVHDWTDLDRAILGNFLGRISLDSYRAGQFLASALAVGAQEMRPSQPFFKLARDVGLLSSRSPNTELEFWVEQMRMAVAWIRTGGGRF